VQKLHGERTAPCGKLDIFFDCNYLWDKVKKCKNTLYFTTLPSDDGQEGKRENIVSKLLNSYQGHLEILEEDISHWKKNGARVVILSGTKAEEKCWPRL